MSINKVILVGNVGRDPEIRYIDRGVGVATFSLATTEKGRTRADGSVVPDRTEWHTIVAWRHLAELAERSIRKGVQLYIEGKIQTRSWVRDGQNRYATEIIAETIQLLGKRPEQPVQPLSNENVVYVYEQQAGQPPISDLDYSSPQSETEPF